MYDLIILGGGPAGLTAATYALYKRMETLLITQDLGGKARFTFWIDEMEGHELIAGRELVDKFRAQIEYLTFAYQLAEVTKVSREKDIFVVETGDNKIYKSRALIVASGAFTEFLNVPGEEALRGRGVSYSAASHAPLVLNHEVAVVGRGERALRAVAELSLVASKVTFFNQDTLPDSPLAGQILKSERVKILEGYQIDEILGTYTVRGVRYSKDGDWYELDVDSVFIELGLEPNSSLVRDFVDCTPEGYIKVDSVNRTNVPGLFAAGDVAEHFTEQILVAIGGGATAALSVYEYLLAQGLMPAWIEKTYAELMHNG